MFRLLRGGNTHGVYVGAKHAMRGVQFPVLFFPFQDIVVIYSRCFLGISESMDVELSPFGLRSLCIEPGYFRTKAVDPANRAPYVNRIEGETNSCPSVP